MGGPIKAGSLQNLPLIFWRAIGGLDLDTHQSWRSVFYSIQVCRTSVGEVGTVDYGRNGIIGWNKTLTFSEEKYSPEQRIYKDAGNDRGDRKMPTELRKKLTGTYAVRPVESVMMRRRFELLQHP